jgi:hypothetical protein
MTDLIQLSDAEIAAVAGGAVDQAINISASQSNSSTLTQTATATNSGPVRRTEAAGAAGPGVVSQAEDSGAGRRHRASRHREGEADQ